MFPHTPHIETVAVFERVAGSQVAPRRERDAPVPSAGCQNEAPSMTTPELPPIRPASTAIVLREAGAADAFEVLMVRRNRSVAFMGGAYVFPGGRVDDGDAVTAADAARGVEGLDQVARCADLSRDDEAAFRIAAIRELFEEAGIAPGPARRAPGGRVGGRAPAHAADEGRAVSAVRRRRTACGWRSTR